MKNELECIHCNESLVVEDILDRCSESHPNLSWIYFTCNSCEKTSHIQVKNAAISTIDFIGAPGPDYKIRTTLNLPDFKVRIDPGYIHVWNKGQHYEYKARV